MNKIIHKLEHSLTKIASYGDGNSYHTTLKIPMQLGWVDEAYFNIEKEGLAIRYLLKHEYNDDTYAHFSTDIYLQTSALYHYYFTFKVNDHYYHYKKENNGDETNIKKEDMWQLSVNFDVPEWAKGEVMYHIFIDRFNRCGKPLTPLPNRTIHGSWDEDVIIGPDQTGRWNTDFYGGNLKGIEEKLPYLKSLGVTIIYLSPVVMSQSNHRYDTADYEIVDPYAGTNEDLKELCTAAHKEGMKVILDAVFNHTGNDSKYFNAYNSFDTIGAIQGNISPYYNFYRHHEYNGNTYFTYWWDMPNLPVCNCYSKSWQDYIYGVGGIIDKWFSLGIDGLRLDVADELSDEFIEGIRTAVKRNKEDGFILGEVWKNPMRMNRGYLSSGKGMDSVMNYQLINALVRYYKYADTNTLKHVIDEEITEYPDDTRNSLMNFTSTHDITRAINLFASDDFNYHGEWSWYLNNLDRNWEKNYHLTKEAYEKGKRIYSSYLYALTFLPGNLSIFYGDEVGLEGMGNLANRRPFPWHNIDYELLNYFKNITSMRKSEPFLKTADLKLIDVTDKYFAFKRKKDNEEITVYVNRTNEEVSLSLPSDYYDSILKYNLNASNKEKLNPYGGIALKRIKMR